MRKAFLALMSTLALCACGHSVSGDPTLDITDAERDARIAIDFSRDSAYIVDYLKPYYPDLSQEQVADWEASKALEGRVIDGQKRYFRNAGRNLFRIDPEARKVFEAVNGKTRDVEDVYLDDYNRDVIATVRSTGEHLVKPVNFVINYALTVKPDAVPAGETVRAWMPYPREDQNSITGVKLIAASEPGYIIAPDDVEHKSIYMEKKAEAGKPTVFNYTFSFTGFNEWYDFAPEDCKPYDKDSELYKTYTSERKTHIVFTDRIKALADSLTAGIENPYLKVKSIYGWIVDNFPWASAREYSTIGNIPMYVLENKHGDCGQVGLLLVTLCRAAGIPARWQSGWMLHPGAVNMHDWSEIYYEGIGWVPTDVSFGRGRGEVKDIEDEYFFYTKGLDAYRLICNSDYSGQFYPAKNFIRSETVDFQRGEVEWAGGNLYFNQWSGWIEEIEYR
ncbi:MAG: transglutaminase domain-containing protein [Bacteroidales bacterium]|nr:transglutaminase domain-containing protein [Bacteroidales bacterium]